MARMTSGDMDVDSGLCRKSVTPVLGVSTDGRQRGFQGGNLPLWLPSAIRHKKAALKPLFLWVMPD